MALGLRKLIEIIPKSRKKVVYGRKYYYYWHIDSPNLSNYVLVTDWIAL